MAKLIYAAFTSLDCQLSSGGSARKPGTHNLPTLSERDSECHGCRRRDCRRHVGLSTDEALPRRSHAVSG
jgi:hypothetical protein